MTIRNAGSNQHSQWFYGFSTDEKPKKAYVGDKFVEIDSCKKYIFSSNNEWEFQTIVVDLAKFLCGDMPMAIGKDGAIIVGDLHEYYFDEGALFQTGSLTPDNIPGESGTQCYEITNGVTQLRMFDYFLSTISNKYSFSIYEVPNRELSEANNDVELLPILVPNRINKKVLPVSIYRIIQGGDAEYVDIDAIGELIKTKTYLLQSDSSSPHSTDAGTKESSDTAIRMNNENYNYVLCIKNEDLEARDFFLSMTFGVVEFLPGSEG